MPITHVKTGGRNNSGAEESAQTIADVLARNSADWKYSPREKTKEENMRNNKLKGAIVSAYGSQGKFAEKIKSSEATVSRVITGRWILTDKEKAQWSKALGYSAEYLFGE